VATIWRVVTYGLQPLTWEVAGAVAALVLWRRRQRRLAFFVLAAIFGTVAIYDIVKAAVARHRPTVPVAVLHAQGASFPSGHAAMSAVAMILVAMAAWQGVRHLAARIAIVVGTFVVAAAVAFSRLALGVHYLSDVLGSWLLAAAWVQLLCAAFGVPRRHPSARPPNPEPVSPRR
jgi:undecaprenyl-diphosphatase